jgi:hypothetical protein
LNKKEIHLVIHSVDSSLSVKLSSILIKYLSKKIMAQAMVKEVLKEKKCPPIWDHYDEEENSGKFVICKHCTERISQGSEDPRMKTCNSMIRHLKVKHPDHHAKFLDAKYAAKKPMSKKPAAVSKKQNSDTYIDGQDLREDSGKRLTLAEKRRWCQLTIPRYVEQGKLWEDDHPEARKLHKLLFEGIIQDNRPWTYVEDLGFLR